MDQAAQKALVAQAALDYIQEGMIVGIGTGTTVRYLIEALTSIKHRIKGTVASSVATERLLKAQGIPLLDFNTVSELNLYIDGADACDPQHQLLKGQGGAMTREKILATASQTFICIIDQSKLVQTLSQQPVCLEVIPMARSFVARAIVKLGGRPLYQEKKITDNGNIILEVLDWLFEEACVLESALDQIPGVVGNGIFAKRKADQVLVAYSQGVEKRLPFDP